MEEQSSSMIKQNSISKLHTLAYNKHEFSQSRRSVASINDLHTISKDNGMILFLTEIYLQLII